jgi:hypothetical protein
MVNWLWNAAGHRREFMARTRHFDAIAARAGVPARSRLVRFAEQTRAEIVSRLGGPPTTARKEFLIGLCIQNAVALELARAGRPMNI